VSAGPAATRPQPPASGLSTPTASFVLGRRAFRNIVRVPIGNLPSLIVPLFILAVNVGALGALAVRGIPEVQTDGYLAYFLPTALLLSITNSAVAAGMGVVRDMDSGYFDKLLLAPVSRLSILLGRLSADGVRAMLQATILLLVGLAFGSGLDAGPLGFVAIVLLLGAWALAYAGVSLAIALRTGSIEATQSSFLLGFPLVFLSSATVPTSQMSDWMRTLAELNPATYLLGAVRHLVLEGWDARTLGEGLLAIAAVACLTVPLSLLALRSRVRRGGAR
jgi:ABC-2 type transport system permease protein